MRYLLTFILFFGAILQGQTGNGAIQRIETAKSKEWKNWAVEVVAKPSFSQFSGSFEPIFDFFFKRGKINFRISSPLKKSKIGSKEPENWLKLGFATISAVGISSVIAAGAILIISTHNGHEVQNAPH